MIDQRVFKIAIVILLGLIVEISYAAECPNMWDWLQTNTGNQNHMSIKGAYATTAEALAARDAWRTANPEYSSTHQEDLYLFGAYDVYGGLYGHDWFCYMAYYCAGGDEWYFAGFVSANDGINGCTGQQDTDGDGIPDDQDPYSDGDPFKFVAKKEVRSSSGTLLYLEIYTSNGDIFRYGDVNAESQCYDGTIDCNITENQVPGNQQEWDNYAYVMDSDALLNYVTDPETEIALVLNDQPVTNQTVIVDGSTGEVEGMTEGTDNTGNTLETDYLYDIVENTKAIADNQQVAADYARQIRDNTSDVKGLLEEIRDRDVTTEADVNVEVSVDSDEIAQKIGDEIREINAEDGVTIESEGAGIEADLQAHIDGLEFDGNIEEGDIPVENDLTGMFDGFVNDNAVSQALQNSGINISDSFCSVDWNYNGRIIEFSICKYQDVLSSMGTILIGLAGLMSLIIVVRG